MSNPESINNANVLSFRLVSNSDALPALAPQWRALLDQSAFPEPMLSPDWLFTWWKYYGHNRKLAVGLFYDRERLVGIAPMCRRIHFYRPGIPFRRLEFMGSGSSDVDGVCSEYLSVIASRGDERAVAIAFIQGVKEYAFGAWDECVLEMINGENYMVSHLTAAFTNAGLAVEHSTGTAAPFITLPRDLDGYLKMLTAKNRQRFRRTLRNFDAWVGKGGYELRRATDQTSFATGWSILNNLHGRRWRADGFAGAFSAERFGSFHYEYTQKILQSGQLDLVWLMASGRPLAAMYNIKTSHKIYFYQGGRDINLPENISIGSVIIALVIQDAINSGYQEFDFMGGAIDYKKRFTSTMRPLVELRAVRPTLREVLRSRSKGARNYLRAIGVSGQVNSGSTAGAGSAGSNEG